VVGVESDVGVELENEVVAELVLELIVVDEIKLDNVVVDDNGFLLGVECEAVVVVVVLVVVVM
jgi:hypothetical protein